MLDVPEVPWSVLIRRKYEKPLFLIEHLVPGAGVTFLYGSSSIGKSPFTWWMARSIASGEPFFGYEARKARVLYLELDSPEQQVVSRLRLLPEPVNGHSCHFAFRMDIIRTPPTEEQLAYLDGLAQRVQPDAVFVNTLRKAHTLDDKESTAPSLVYSTYRTCFPGAALVFVHHQTKRLRDQKGRPLSGTFEDYSGSKAWENDAQVAVKLEEEALSEELGTTTLKMRVFKSQVGPKVEARYVLGMDKATITRPELEIREFAAAHPGATQRDIAELLKVSQSTVSRVLRKE